LTIDSYGIALRAIDLIFSPAGRDVYIAPKKIAFFISAARCRHRALQKIVREADALTVNHQLPTG